MEFKGEFEVRAEKHEVFSFISDIQKVTSIIPDVLHIEGINDNSSKLIVKAGQSAIKGKFNLLLEIKNRVEDQSVEISARGAGTTGSIDINAVYIFSSFENGSTSVKWNVNLTVGGMVATMGSRIINNTAEKYISVLTESFRKAFEK
ncbi:MAG: SRPBCC domain-containing protein [Thermoplasmatales archaeon]